jgi:GNAT superfamily N-acetyltransferase
MIKILDDPRKVSDSLAMCLDSWSWFMNSKKHWWAVAFEGKFWVAYGAISIYDDNTVYLGPDYTTEKARGHGLQYELIKARHRWARRHGYTFAIAVVEPLNIKSANNYIKAGYHLRKPWHGFSENSALLWFERAL